MLIPLAQLVQRHSLQIRRILHVGAHLCEERADYQAAGVKDDNIHWVEGNGKLVQTLKRAHPRLHLYHAVVADKDGRHVDFIVTNNGQSSSILELAEHKKEHPSVVEIYREPRQTCRLDTLLTRHRVAPVDFLNLDIQGAELLALKGLGHYLHHVRYIYTEVNTKALYQDCALLTEVDDFLTQEGFVRKELSLTPHGWGDAFYVRERAPTFLVVDFSTGLCGGLGDRIVGLVSGVLLARITRRQLLVDWGDHPSSKYLWQDLHPARPHHPYLATQPTLEWDCVDQRFRYQTNLSQQPLDQCWKEPVVRLRCNQEIASFVYDNPHYPELKGRFLSDLLAVYSTFWTNLLPPRTPFPPRPSGQFIGLQIRAGDTHMKCGHVEYMSRQYVTEVILPQCYERLKTQYPPQDYSLFITSDLPCYAEAQKIWAGYNVFSTEGPIDHFERQGQTEGLRKTLTDLYLLSQADVVVFSWQSNFGRVAALMNPTQQVYAIDAQGQWGGPFASKQCLSTKHQTSRDRVDSWPPSTAS